MTTFTAVGDCESGSQRIAALDITSGTCDTARQVAGAYAAAVGAVPPPGPIAVAGGWSCNSAAAGDAHSVVCARAPSAVSFYLRP